MRKKKIAAKKSDRDLSKATAHLFSSMV